MAGFGAVGRFAVAGWRLDLLRVDFATPDALALGEASFQPGSGTKITVVPEVLVLADAPYRVSVGVKIDAAAGDPLVLEDTPYNAQDGASATYVPPDPLVLEEAAFDVPAGNQINFVPEPIALVGASFAPQAGVAISFAVTAIELGEASFQPGSGTKAEYAPPDAIVLSDVAYPAAAGATVNVAAARRRFIISATGGFATGAGPVIYIGTGLELGSAKFSPQAGATANLAREELVLRDVAFEVGARRKPIRSQFFIYR